MLLRNSLLIVALLCPAVVPAVTDKAQGEKVDANVIGKNIIFKGTLVSVGTFDETTHSFPVSVVKKPKLGSFSVDPKELAIAADIDGPKDTLEKRPGRIEGAEILLKFNMHLIPAAEMKTRRAKWSDRGK